ncbi:MAG: hypothetical protein HN736_11335 [Anaerolineae bacterium]|jgi:hypothetical protein|nr:hypothetical protein [Anaerolineae bacterium]MBT7484136.1 hypothetical protein [Candidatus Peregrinibacteria bacterium]MBT4312447.1 hypothetical protein [Anaerolineae bacterium]MBT4458705.1 hypothetical protein [Anaerolineae bacterium]MBT4842284.1 hypothetical protein [Anaerolineae bacterium]
MKNTAFIKLFSIQNTLIAFLLGLIILVQLSSLIPSTHSAGRDSGIFLYIGNLILDGKVPYIDAWENKGPLVFYINALGLLLGAGSRWGVWGIEFFFLFFTALAGYKLFKKAFGLLPAIFGIVIWVLSMSKVQQGGNLTEQYSLLFSFIGIACYLWGIGKPQMRRFDFFLGLSFGLNFLLRPNNVGVQLAIIFSFFAFSILESNWKLFFQRIIYISLGSFLIILPALLYFASVNALDELFKIVFIFNFQYSSEFSVAQILRGFIQGCSYFNFWIISLSLIGYLWMLVKFIRRSDKKSIDAKFHFAIFLYWPFEIILSSFSGRNYPHYFITWTPIIGILSAYGFKEILERFTIKLERHHTIILSISVLAISVLAQHNLASYAPVLSSLSQGVSLKSTEYTHPVAIYIQENTQPNDRVLVWGFRPIINFMSEREAPAAYLPYPAMHVRSQESYEWAEQYYNQLLVNKPSLIVDMTDISIDEMPSLNPEIRKRQIKESAEWIIAHNLEDVLSFFDNNYTYHASVTGHTILRLRDIKP